LRNVRAGIADPARGYRGAGGYSLLRVYTGGYVVSYYKNRTDLARAWGQRSRHEYYTLYPHYMGTIADRNHSVTRDLSGLRPL